MRLPRTQHSGRSGPNDPSAFRSICTMNTRQVSLVSVLVIGMGVSRAQANVLQSDAATAYQSLAPLPTTTMQIDPPYNLPVSALSVATPPTGDPFDISISQAVSSVLADGSAAATYSRV